MLRLEGKSAFVTGGASGIGRAIVERFVKEGASVVFCDIDIEGGTDVAHTLKDSSTGSCRYVHCDVSNEERVQQVLEANYGKSGRLDILVNNAVVFLFGKVQDVTEATWDRVFGVNVKGYAFTVKHALKYLRNSPAPSIVNMGSISSFVAQPAFVPYNTSKGAILELTRALAMVLAPHIRVNLVCPGGIDTPATARHADSQGKTKDQVIRVLSALHLIPRMGGPDEVASAVLFLASDEASFITGHPLMVDAGWSVR